MLYANSDESCANSDESCDMRARFDAMALRERVRAHVCVCARVSARITFLMQRVFVGWPLSVSVSVCVLAHCCAVHEFCISLVSFVLCLCPMYVSV